MQDCTPISTLFLTNIKLSSKMSPSSEKERMEMSRVPYASAVGSLMFAMICTRPDIAHAVGVVSRYMAEPGREHWEAVKIILRYIKGTSDVALCYGESGLTVKGYVASDYAGDLDGSKSTTGYVFTLSGGTVSWVSKLQSVVAMSTTEAEYVAAAQASKEAVWLKMLLEELGHEQEKITLFCDNQSALYLARNPAFHSKTKHIRVQYHFVREKVEEGTVDMQKIHTDDNVADYMTKAINCDKFIWCRSSCGLAETIVGYSGLWWAMVSYTCEMDGGMILWSNMEAYQAPTISLFTWTRRHSTNTINRAMATKFEIEKFNGNNFSLWKLKMKVILRKDKCLAAIGERPAEVTDDSKWDEMDGNGIANLHLALADGVLHKHRGEEDCKGDLGSSCSIVLVFEMSNLCLGRRKIGATIGEDRHQFKTGGSFGGDKREGNVASTSDDGNTLCCEAAVANEDRKRFTDVLLFDIGASFHMTARREWFHQYKPIFGGGSVYSCNDHELKIIGIGSVMVKMHDVNASEARTYVDRMKDSCGEEANSWPHKELVHSDVWQAPVLSLGGAKYFVSFIDDYSRRCWVYPIKKKSDVFEVFKVYKARVELDSGTKIKCLRTDNGGEYTGDEFDLFCKQEGIKRQFTTAYTPQQNGVAERMNRNC
ncbi:retrovirus-related pol polyprotein from transposon TNT 1-94 [Tanacetum coccineum]